MGRESAPQTHEAWPITAAVHQFGNAQNGSAAEWRTVLTQVSEAGFRHLDLTDSWIRPADLARPRLAQLREMLNEAGLECPVISVTRRSVGDPAAGLDNLDYTYRTIEAGGALGVRVLSLGLHRPLTEAQRAALWFWHAEGAADRADDREAWETVVHRFREIGRRAADADMIVSLEMYEDTYLGTADSAVRLVQEIGLPNVGLNPDVANLIRLHRPVEDWRDVFAKTLPYTNYWQVKNYARDEDPATGAVVTHPVPLVQGIINYRQVVSDALALGFRGIFCCEHYGGDGLGVSAENMRYLRTLLPAESTVSGR